MAYASAPHDNTIVDEVSINPFYTFLLLFVTPYIVFFLLLMLVTGQTDIELLYTSVINESNAAILKAWVIGSFVLSMIGSLFFSGYRTTDYIARRLRANKPMEGGSVLPVEPSHFVIEEVQHDLPETTTETMEHPAAERYARLDSAIDDTQR